MEIEEVSGFSLETVRRLASPFVTVACEHAPFKPVVLEGPESAIVADAVPKRVAEFTAGRSCARQALTQLGCEVSSICAGPNREPLWPVGFVGSITHTDDVACAVVSSRDRLRSLGVDVEHRSRVDMNLEPMIATKTERARMSDDPLRRQLERTLLFSAKEAYYKAQFPLTGQRLGFDEVEIELDFDAPSSSSSNGAFSVDGPIPANGRFAISSDHVVTLVEVPVR